MVVCGKFIGNVSYFLTVRSACIYTTTVGAMAGYHSALAIHPGTSYGVSILMAGHYGDAAKLAYDAFEIFQPFMDSLLASLASDLYSGTWSSVERNSTAVITVDKGVLFLDKYILEGVDALAMFFAPGRLGLRSDRKSVV